MRFFKLTIIIFFLFLIIGCSENLNQKENIEKIENKTISNLNYYDMEEISFKEYNDLLTIELTSNNSQNIFNWSDPMTGYNQTYNLKKCNNQLEKINFTNEKNIIFEFNYDNKNFEYSINLFEDIYEYSNNIKDQDCYWNESFYENKYFQDPYNNKFMDIISNDFYKLKNKGFNENEILEIATIFIQTIDYETENGSNKYPYETIYEKKGNCLDKSIILINILKKLGFETYLIFGNLDKENHALIGVNCEESNLIYNSKKICPIETTILSTIGEETNITDIEFKQFSEGKQYIEQKYGDKYLQELNKSLIKLETLSTELEKSSSKLKEIAETLGDSGWRATTLTITQYNNLVDEHNEMLPEYNILAEEFNEIMFKIDKKVFFNLFWPNLKKINNNELTFENCGDWALYNLPDYLIANNLNNKIELITKRKNSIERILENITWRDNKEINIYGNDILRKGNPGYGENKNYYYSHESTYLTHGKKGEKDYLKIRDLTLKQIEESNKYIIITYYIGSCTH